MASADFLFRAFADETRLRILAFLRRGELCVCDLVRALDMSQPKVSRHLAYLRRAGLVVSRRDGKWCRYSLARPGTPFQRRLVSCLDVCFAGTPILEKDLTRLGAARGKSCK